MRFSSFFESYLWDFILFAVVFNMSNVKEIVELFEALSSPPQQPRAGLGPPPVPAPVPSEDYWSVRDPSSVAPSDVSYASYQDSLSDSFSGRQGNAR